MAQEQLMLQGLYEDNLPVIKKEVEDFFKENPNYHWTLVNEFMHETSKFMIERKLESIEALINGTGNKILIDAIYVKDQNEEFLKNSSDLSLYNFNDIDNNEEYLQTIIHNSVVEGLNLISTLTDDIVFDLSTLSFESDYEETDKLYVFYLVFNNGLEGKAE